MSKYISTYLIALALALFATSCNDELDTPIAYEVGKDVVVKVPVEIPGMEVKSRANIPDYQINQVNSVWIRTYSETTGKATMEWKKISESVDIHPAGSAQALKEVELNTKTGKSYIVAVANVDGAKGVKKGDLTEMPLEQLLENADTWEEFLNIAVATPSDFNDVNVAPAPFVMAGCYTEATTDPDISQWQTSEFNFKPFDITDEVTTLTGAIHLRRVVSQITFNLIPGGDIILTPNSYRVVNVPKYSWLYERGKSDNGITANFGDAASNANDAENYYCTPGLYINTYFDKGDKEGSYKFSFWQAENKHTGISSCKEYNDRQIKNESGLFTSLTGDTWTPDNMATYVIINCDVDYENPIKIGPNGEINGGDTEAKRSGNADFIIHLGYVGNDATDFNSYRNTKYTYNVTVSGIDKIRVEAYAKDENDYTNGMEGIVTDITGSTQSLDCHYHAYNIQLTEEDFENFGFIITTYDGGIRYTYNDETFRADQELTETERQHISWVELRPTTGADILADYKPAGDGSDTFNLLDASRGNLTKSAGGWYTVFVNEYTYEDNDGNEEGTNWIRYVNQPSRRFYIRVQKQTSSDGYSIYATSKYAGVQRSIQTYYSNTNYPTSGGVLGVEHENEVFGMNVGRHYTYAASTVNGRLNVWCWLNKVEDIPTTQSVLPDWADYIVPSTMQHIYGVNNKQGITIPEHDAAVPALTHGSYDYSIEVPNVLPQGDANDSRYWIEAINACMNRNRDNNGNGKIDPEELRWYVPAKAKYLRIILGRNALSTPLSNYDAVPQLISDSKEVALKFCTRLMYFTSDGNAILSFNGTSSSTWIGEPQYEIGSTPWDVRCVRNLGTNLTTVTEEDKTVPAYTHENRIVTMTYYDTNSYRMRESFSGNGKGDDGTMPVHIINNTRYNTPYWKFEYSEGQSQHNGNRYDGVISKSTTITEVAKIIEENNPCKQIYGDGWRLPNITELSIMRNLGLFDNFYDNNEARRYILSCTKTYYDSSGAGYDKNPGTQRNFLGAIYNNTVEIPVISDNTFERDLYYRCVRDVK